MIKKQPQGYVSKESIVLDKTAVNAEPYHLIYIPTPVQDMVDEESYTTVLTKNYLNGKLSIPEWTDWYHKQSLLGETVILEELIDDSIRALVIQSYVIMSTTPPSTDKIETPASSDTRDTRDVTLRPISDSLCAVIVNNPQLCSDSKHLHVAVARELVQKSGLDNLMRTQDSTLLSTYINSI